LYVQIDPSDITGLGIKSYSFTIRPTITITGEKYDYNVSIDSIIMQVGGCEIQESVLTKNRIKLLQSNEDVLKSLIYTKENKSLSFSTDTGTTNLNSDSVRL
jgi:hypothetical protein